MALAKRQRIDWVDVVKGFGIFLVVYGHNFPILETYIYGFHMPLFFFLSGLFHPIKITTLIVKKRAQQILIPYFSWSTLLFLFWFFIGRKYGESSEVEASVFKNFIGIFFAQGNTTYMNWGMPMWFLPSIFLTFLIFGFIQKIKQKLFQVLIIVFLVILGFLMPKVLNVHFVWSIDVTLVSLFFYTIAFYLKNIILNYKIKYEVLALLALLVLHSILSLNLSTKVDMYRSIYGNEIFFLTNALLGVAFWILFFKKIGHIKILNFFGKNTLLVLVLHLRILTVIKLLLVLFWSSKSFEFNELEKLILVVIQLFILYPIIVFINKNIPFLNGKIQVKKARN